LKVAVIGGGIQGTCVAMELAARGVEVDLIESNPSLMDEASRNTEGKIHLGFVYANDLSFRTAELMFRGARHFAPLMRLWLGDEFDDVPVSTPFNYAVHRNSLLTAAQLEQTYRAISRRIRDVADDGSYFGIEEPHLVERLPGSDRRYGSAVDAIFSTREVAINPGNLADLIVKTVADRDGIRVIADATVTSVDVANRRLEVSRGEQTGSLLGPYDHVVNCAWGGRPALDATAGLFVEGAWTFRMKYFVLAVEPTGASPLPSTTVVLGGFGDVVDYGTGEYYLSWYPSGRLGWSTELIAPSWPTRPGAAEAIEVARSTLHHLERVVPGVGRFRTQIGDNLDVRGGVIYSRGNTDVDDPASEFHKRSAVGPRSLGRYHSVDTGKYTTAPLFAMEAADLVTGAS
jgi:glycine/D-amino acid oxidase-like deaminating enzyme